MIKVDFERLHEALPTQLNLEDLRIGRIRHYIQELRKRQQLFIEQHEILQECTCENQAQYHRDYYTNWMRDSDERLKGWREAIEAEHT